jgi:hypothetical protein
MATALKELARQHGRKLDGLGISHSTARSIACGQQKAGPDAIARIAATLGVPTLDVAQACDAAWAEKQHAV